MTIYELCSVGVIELKVGLAYCFASVNVTCIVDQLNYTFEFGVHYCTVYLKKENKFYLVSYLATAMSQLP